MTLPQTSSETLTQDTHNIFSVPYLCSDRLVPSRESCFFLFDDIDRGFMHHIDDISELVQSWGRDNVDYEASERWRAELDRPREDKVAEPDEGDSQETKIRANISS